MVQYLARRIITVFLPILFGISILVFGAMRLIPGNFVDILIGIGPDVSADQRASIAAAYGLDKPVPVQYVLWLSNVLRGDMGTSLRSGQPVASELLAKLPATLELAALATIVSLLIAIPLGVLAALNRGGIIDGIARIVGLLGLSVPNFLLGTLLILFISTRWQVLPTTGFVPVTHGLGANLKSLILPSLSLGSLLAASVLRMTRSAVLEELGREYLTVARAKGLSQRAIVLGHLLKNALIPVITIVGIQIGYLLGGTVIVEQIFAIPGIGRLALDAVNQRDYPLVQGVTLVIAGFFVFMNLLTDVLYGLVDPRIRVRD